jgi:hypothetical protein
MGMAPHPYQLGQDLPLSLCPTLTIEHFNPIKLCGIDIAMSKLILTKIHHFNYASLPH